MKSKLLRTILNNPLVWYYRNLRANHLVLRGVKRASIDPAAMVFNSVIADFVKIGPRVILVRASIGPFSYVSQDSRLSMVRVGKFTSIGPHVKIGYGRHPVDRPSTHPIFYSDAGQCGLTLRSDKVFEEQAETVIGNDVWIGMAAMVMDGITINDGAVVAAGSVVTSDVPPYAIVGGIPAKLIKFRATQDEITALRALAWWDWSEEKLRENLDAFNGSITDFLAQVSGDGRRSLKPETERAKA